MNRRVNNSIENIAKVFCKICPCCDRNVPNHEFFTVYNKLVKGCRWCDKIYHRRRK